MSPNGMFTAEQNRMANMKKNGLLYFIAQGIKSKLPDAEVNVKEDGVEVVFTKEMILKRLFERADALSQVTEVEVDSRGIVVKVKL